jgi:checkpoint serine/threonine-protein kinase
MTFFRPGTNFMAKVKTEGFQCQEMIEGRPWTYQIDMFGVMACIYIIAKGEYPKWKKDTVGRAIFPPLNVGMGALRSYVHRDIWNQVGKTLVGIADCDSIPSLKPLINKMRKTFLSSLLESYEKKYDSYVQTLKRGDLA